MVRSNWFAIAIGGLAPIAVAMLLVPLRDEIDNANLALILVLVVVVVASLGGRARGRDGGGRRRRWRSTSS